MEIEISNDVEIINDVKISNQVEISNRSERETQPSGSRLEDQLRQDEAKSGPLYSWRECHVMIW